VQGGAPVSVWTGASALSHLGYPVCFFSGSRFLAGWNGLEDQGQSAPSGTYFYVIQCGQVASSGLPSGSFELLNQPNDARLLFTVQPNLLGYGDQMVFKTAWSNGTPAVGKIVVFTLNGEKVTVLRVDTLTTKWTPEFLASGLYLAVLTSQNPTSGVVIHQRTKFMIAPIAR